MKHHDFPNGKLLHVAISLHNPIVLKTDLDVWNVESILQKAALKLLKIPYQSQQSVYLYEQRAVAQDAWRLLKTLGIDKNTALKWHGMLNSPEWVQLQPLYEETLRKRCLSSPYDGIVYQNDYEQEFQQDSTCYIVFRSSQVKSIEPIYGSDGRIVPLSSRFDMNSPLFEH